MQETGSRLLAFWEYAVEVVLAVLCCALVLLLRSTADLLVILCRLRGDLLVGTGIVLGIGCAIWVGLLAVFASDFGGWLRTRGEAGAYSRALATPLVVYMAAFVVVMLTACRNSHFFPVLNLFALVYCAINFVTMIRNVHKLVMLWQTWEQSRYKR
jgi:hypothetical protein